MKEMQIFHVFDVFRYLRCPAAVSVAHLKKLIQAKYDLNDNHRVDILYNQDCLISSLTLMDISYIYNWKKVEIDFISKMFAKFVFLYFRKSHWSYVTKYTNVHQKR